MGRGGIKGLFTKDKLLQSKHCHPYIIQEKQRYLAMSDQCSDIEKKINFMKEAPAAPPPVISRVLCGHEWCVNGV